jgi:hypothetical protein
MRRWNTRRNSRVRVRFTFLRRPLNCRGGSGGRRNRETDELMLGSVRLNRLSTPNINQRLSSTLLGIACLMVYSLYSSYVFMDDSKFTEDAQPVKDAFEAWVSVEPTL